MRYTKHVMTKRGQLHNAEQHPEDKRQKVDHADIIANHIMLKIFNNLPIRHSHFYHITDNTFPKHASQYAIQVKQEIESGDLSYIDLLQQNTFKQAALRITQANNYGPNIFQVVADQAVITIKQSKDAFYLRKHYHNILSTIPNADEIYAENLLMEINKELNRQNGTKTQH